MPSQKSVAQHTHSTEENEKILTSKLRAGRQCAEGNEVHIGRKWKNKVMLDGKRNTEKEIISIQEALNNVFKNKAYALVFSWACVPQVRHIFVHLAELGLCSEVSQAAWSDISIWFTERHEPPLPDISSPVVLLPLLSWQSTRGSCTVSNISNALAMGGWRTRAGGESARLASSAHASELDISWRHLSNHTLCPQPLHSSFGKAKQRILTHLGWPVWAITSSFRSS